MNCIELFTGAGGLALGVARAGFKHLALVERDADSCKTLTLNKRLGIKFFSEWPIYQQDVCTFDFSQLKRPVHLVAGGPPCQPFSLGGKHRGHQDTRNLFPQAFRAVRELRPAAFVFENVKGLLRSSFAKYFSYIELQLRHPSVTLKSGETWEDHLARLEKHHTGGDWDSFHYNVIYSLLNAANYGVPQRRERVFFVGIRADLGLEWSFPRKTHSSDSLLWSQGVSGEYWDRHEIKPRVDYLASRAVRIAHLKKEDIPSSLPWLTVRDAFVGLPDPEIGGASGHRNHVHNPGARSYPGHTGSDYDEPAKVLKAGDHGVPGGENMLAKPDGRVRYFTVRESARLQTFPDEMSFPSSWTESMRQIGNAVPVKLAEIVATDLRNAVKKYCL